MKPKTKSYPLNPSGLTTVEMPKGSRPLLLFRDSVVAHIDPHAPLVDRTFLVAHIGAELPDDVHLDFVGATVGRLCFEVRTRDQLRALTPCAFDALDQAQVDNLFFKEIPNGQ